MDVEQKARFRERVDELDVKLCALSKEMDDWGAKYCRCLIPIPMRTTRKES